MKAGGKFELRLNLFTYDSEKNNKLWPNITRNETPEKLGNYLKVKDHKFKIELTMLCRFTRPKVLNQNLPVDAFSMGIRYHGEFFIS